MVKEASAILLSGEFDSFLVKDPDALTILTDLYDTHAHEPEWRNAMKTTGVDVLKNPCLTLLGGTNEDHLATAISEKDVKGGFIARTIVVLERDRRTINDLMDPPKIVPNIKDLADYLKEVSKVKGIFEVSEDARTLYKLWYRKVSTDKHEDPTGSIERLGDTVLKVAMAINLSKTLELIISVEAMGEAIQKCQDCIGGMKLVTMGSGKSELAAVTALILKDLIKRPENRATRKQLLSKYWGELDAIILDRVIETLEGAGAIDIARAGKETIYMMKKQYVESYTRMQHEIN
jgi:hypothetical protein